MSHVLSSGTSGIMSTAGSLGRSGRRSSAYTSGLSRSVTSLKVPDFPCDSCLWNEVPSTTEAVYSCVTCLHCFCAKCLRELAKPSGQPRREAGNVLWFRCPVPMCSIMIQANHQIRELHSKNLPAQLQYLHKSQQSAQVLATLQKVVQFNLDNNMR